MLAEQSKKPEPKKKRLRCTRELSVSVKSIEGSSRLAANRVSSDESATSHAPAKLAPAVNVSPAIETGQEGTCSARKSSNRSIAHSLGVSKRDVALSIVPNFEPEQESECSAGPSSHRTIARSLGVSKRDVALSGVPAFELEQEGERATGPSSKQTMAHSLELSKRDVALSGVRAFELEQEGVRAAGPSSKRTIAHSLGVSKRDVALSVAPAIGTKQAGESSAGFNRTITNSPGSDGLSSTSPTPIRRTIGPKSSGPMTVTFSPSDESSSTSVAEMFEGFKERQSRMELEKTIKAQRESIEKMAADIDSLQQENAKLRSLNMLLQESLVQKREEVSFKEIKGFPSAEWLLSVSQDSEDSDYLFVKQLMFRLFPHGVGNATPSGRPSNNPKGRNKGEGSMELPVQRTNKLDPDKLSYMKGKKRFIRSSVF